MNILLGFKASADLTMMAEKDWQIDDKGYVDVSFTQTMLNCFDESAAELMLMARDDAHQCQNTELKLNALTIGDSKAEYYLKQFYALGFNSVNRIELSEPEILLFNPFAVATIIAKWNNKIEQQSLIVLGVQSNEGQNMQTAMLLAEQLQWPCITEVSHFSIITNTQQVIVTREIEGQQQTLTLTMPAVLAIGNSTQACALRVPTLKQKLAGSKKSVAIYSLDHLELSPQILQNNNDKMLMTLARQRHQRAGQIIEGNSPQEKARQLFRDYLKERLI